MEAVKPEGLKALMVDMDGTLIGKGPLTLRVAAAVRRIATAIPVSIATGREFQDVLEVARFLELKAPQICEGGATAFDPADGSIIWTNSLPEMHIEVILEVLRKTQCELVVSHVIGRAAASPSAVAVNDLSRISAMDIDESTADGLVARFGDQPDLSVVKVYLYYNDSWAVDFTSAGVDKGAAAERLANLLGIETSQMIAIGDSYNDIPMFKICGLAVVMGDAPPEVKALADYVAPSVERDGLAVAIDEFVLPRLQFTRPYLP